MERIKIEDVQIDLDVVTAENESLAQLKTRNIFPKGELQTDSYKALWGEIVKKKPKPVKEKKKEDEQY